MGEQSKRKHQPWLRIREDTQSAGVGPLTLDVAMARRHGWSEKAIAGTYDRIASMARQEAHVAHTRDNRRGTVPGCPCAHCDTKSRPCGYEDCRSCYPRRARRPVATKSEGRTP